MFLKLYHFWLWSWAPKSLASTRTIPCLYLISWFGFQLELEKSETCPHKSLILLRYRYTCLSRKRASAQPTAGRDTIQRSRLTDQSLHFTYIHSGSLKAKTLSSCPCLDSLSYFLLIVTPRTFSGAPRMHNEASSYKSKEKGSYSAKEKHTINMTILTGLRRQTRFLLN